MQALPYSVYMTVHIPQSSNSVTFISKKCEKPVVQACKLLKSLSRSLEAAQKKFSKFIISLFLMREVKIRFISLSFFLFIFENFDEGQEVYHFMDLRRWDEGAYVSVLLALHGLQLFIGDGWLL